MIRLQWRMEYRKHRLNWLACGLLVLIILTFGVLGAIREGWPLGETVQLCSLFASPLIFLLLGASAGISLRREDWKKWDELLPITPRQRVWSAYCCSLSVAALVLIILALFFLTEAPFLIDVTSLQDPLGDLLNIPTLFVALLCFYLHGVAFAATYWFNSTFLGGGISLVLSGGTLWVIWWQLATLSSILHWGNQDTYYCINTLYPLILALMPIGVCLVIWFLPEKIELKKRPHPLFSLAMLACLCLGAAGSFLLPLRVKWVDENILFANRAYQNRQSELIRTGTTGIILSTNSGTLFHMTAEGKRTALYEASPLPWRADVSYYPWDFHLLKDGTLWLMADESEYGGPYLMRLYKGALDTPLQPVSEQLPSPSGRVFFRKRGDRLLLFNWKLENNAMFFSELPLQGTPLRWQEVPGTLSDFLLEPYVQTGEIAVLDEGGRTLRRQLPSGNEIVWELPFPAKAPVSTEFIFRENIHKRNSERWAIPLGKTDQGLFYGVCLLRPQGLTQFALCMPDGSVRTPWPPLKGGRWQISASLGGNLLTLGDSFCLVAHDGTAYPAIYNAAELGKKVKNAWYNGDDRVGPAFKIADDKVWLGAKEGIALLDLSSGNLLRYTPLAKSETDLINYWAGFRRKQEGFYFSRNGELFRINWDGSETGFGSLYVKDWP